MRNDKPAVGVYVICRIGSLENERLKILMELFCYLPYRQLRNADNQNEEVDQGYLPYRQLRNITGGLQRIP